MSISNRAPMMTRHSVHGVSDEAERVGVETRQRGGRMPRKSDKMTTSRQLEAAGIRLFDRIDRGVQRYIVSTGNDFLRVQALRNAIAMLDILKVMYKNEYRHCFERPSSGVILSSEACCTSPELRDLRQ